VKASISKGAGFSGLCRYVLDIKLKQKSKEGAKRADVIGGNIESGSYADIMKQFAVVRSMRPDIERPVWHCSLSFPPEEDLDNETMARVAEEFMKLMNFSEEYPFVVVRHFDKAHAHIHIVVSRISLGGEVWRSGQDVFKAIKATQVLEERFGLIRTPGFNEKTEKKKPKFSEKKMEERTGESPTKVLLQELIDDVVGTEPTIVEFCEYLELNGVKVRANLASTGKFNGFSFLLNGIAFKGSSLGNAYSWGQLNKRGVSYEMARDFERLKTFSVLGELGREESGIEESKTLVDDDGSAKGAETESRKVFESSKGRLKALILEAVLGQPSVVEFCEWLKGKKVYVKVNLARTGHLSGVSFLIDGVIFKGSSLGKGFSWGGLQKLGVTYKLERDLEELKKFQTRVFEEEELADEEERAEKKKEEEQVEEIAESIEAANNELLEAQNKAFFEKKEAENKAFFEKKEAQKKAFFEKWAREKAWFKAEELALLNLKELKELKGKLSTPSAFVRLDDEKKKKDSFYLPTWLKEQYDVKRFVDEVYVFHKRDNSYSEDKKSLPDPLMAVNEDSISFHETSDATILDGLRLAKSMWGPWRIRIDGNDEFKAKVKLLAEKNNLGIVFAEGKEKKGYTPSWRMS
jgi:hypothetical protein